MHSSPSLEEVSSLGDLDGLCSPTGNAGGSSIFTILNKKNANAMAFWIKKRDEWIQKSLFGWGERWGEEMNKASMTPIKIQSWDANASFYMRLITIKNEAVRNAWSMDLTSKKKKKRPNSILSRKCSVLLRKVIHKKLFPVLLILLQIVSWLSSLKQFVFLLHFTGITIRLQYLLDVSLLHKFNYGNDGLGIQVWNECDAQPFFLFIDDNWSTHNVHKRIHTYTSSLKNL